MSTLRRIASIRADEPFILAIQWMDGGSDVVDMTGVIRGFEPFAPLKDAALFAQVDVAGWGSGVEWPNGLDYSATSLAHLAEEQSEMTGEGFRLWQAEMKLSIQETADFFGVSVSTVKNYRKLARLPIAIQIACNTVRKDPVTFYARYRPRLAGRPRKAAPTRVAG